MSYYQERVALTREQMDTLVRSPWGLLKLMRTYTPFSWCGNHLEERHYRVAMNTAAAHMNSQRFPDFIEYFLKRRDQEDTQEMIAIALSMVVRLGHLSSVKELLDNYPTPSKIAMTRLVSVAAKYGHLPTMFLLIRRGAVPDHSAVIQSVRKKHTNILRFLIEHNKKPPEEGGGWLKMRERMYVKCLRLAMRQCDEPSMIFLLEQNYIPIDDENIHLVLWWACLHDKPTIVKNLLSNGITIYETSPCSLYEAIHRNNVEIVKLFLDYGKKLTKDLLRSSVRDNHPKIVQLLVDYGADCMKLTEKEEKEIIDYWLLNEHQWLRLVKQNAYRERLETLKQYIPVNPRRLI